MINVYVGAVLNNTFYFMAKSACFRQVSLRPITCYTNQNLKSKCSSHSSKSLHLEKRVWRKSWDVCQPWGLRYWVHPSTFQPVIICERRQMKKLNWILSKNRILVSVWKFYHLSNDCHIAYPALVCSPSNRKPCNKHLISLVFFFNLWSVCLGHKLMGKKLSL